MTEALVVAVAAILGGVLLYFLRNDTDEFKIGRNLWVANLTIMFGGAMLMYHTQSPLHWIEAVAAMVTFLFVLTYAHGPILSPPGQPHSEGPDLIESAIMRVTGKKTGDKMGGLNWWLYAAFRYYFPITAIFILLGSTLTLGAWAGAFAVWGYWPIGYAVAKGENTKYVGAAFFGTTFFGLLALGLYI